MNEEESHSTHISEVWPEIRGYSVVDGEYTLIHEHGAGAFDIPIERVFDAVNYIIKHRKSLIPKKYQQENKTVRKIQALPPKCEIRAMPYDGRGLVDFDTTVENFTVEELKSLVKTWENPIDGLTTENPDGKRLLLCTDRDSTGEQPKLN